MLSKSTVGSFLASLAVLACTESTAVQSTSPDLPARRSMLTASVPTTVTVAGSFESELGCLGDWDPACSLASLTYNVDDDVWQGVLAVPAGNYEYKAALNGTWDENYGQNAILNGANIALGATGVPVKFYYDDKTHWITDNVNSVIPIAAGDFQSELGCPGDWDPSCLRAWLEDPDGNGTYTFTTTAIPAGDYFTKVAIGESWTENYGQGGAANGSNIPFTVPAAGAAMTFSYDATSHVLTVSTDAPSVNDQIDDLRATIEEMGLQKGMQSSLESKLDTLEWALDANDMATACQSLSDTVNFTRAQRGKKIPTASADEILAAVAELQSAVGC